MEIKIPNVIESSDLFDSTYAAEILSKLSGENIKSLVVGCANYVGDIEEGDLTFDYVICLYKNVPPKMAEMKQMYRGNKEDVNWVEYLV